MAESLWRKRLSYPAQPIPRYWCCRYRVPRVASPCLPCLVDAPDCFPQQKLMSWCWDPRNVLPAVSSWGADIHELLDFSIQNVLEFSVLEFTVVFRLNISFHNIISYSFHLSTPGPDSPMKRWFSDLWCLKICTLGSVCHFSQRKDPKTFQLVCWKTWKQQKQLTRKWLLRSLSCTGQDGCVVQGTNVAGWSNVTAQVCHRNGCLFAS